MVLDWGGGGVRVFNSFCGFCKWMVPKMKVTEIYYHRE